MLCFLLLSSPVLRCVVLPLHAAVGVYADVEYVVLVAKIHPRLDSSCFTLILFVLTRLVFIFAVFVSFIF